jgi:hypothetical protein
LEEKELESLNDLQKHSQSYIIRIQEEIGATHLEKQKAVDLLASKQLEAGELARKYQEALLSAEQKRATQKASALELNVNFSNVLVFILCRT